MMFEEVDVANTSTNIADDATYSFKDIVRKRQPAVKMRRE